MKELLFLAHRIPYPPNKGDKLRSYNLLTQLGRDYRVHLGAFIDAPDDWRHIDALRALSGECHFAPLTPRPAERARSGVFRPDGPIRRAGRGAAAGDGFRRHRFRQMAAICRVAALAAELGVPARSAHFVAI